MQRCMGCMAELNAGLQACPICGYVVDTPPKEAYHLAPGSLLNQRYTAGRVLGYGGFGVTYIGYDLRLGRAVAIKEFLPSTFATRMPGDTLVTVYAGEATEQFGAGLSRFLEEAQRLAQFNGVPGIVDIYDTFSANGTAYIVMEYLKGQDLKNILTANGPLPYEQAREIVLKVCDTLQPVHASGIIHRDISPDNIYLTEEGEVKLLDFGASRYATSVNSKSLSVILKAGYAPEEQYRSRGEQGPWSDVYALAATFYKMLTGVTPDDAMERAIRDELKEPSKLGATLPKAAENAVMNALNVKQSDRIQSAEAFKTALQADDVERVKVKAVKSDAGTTPKWLKFVLGGAGALLLAFGLLTLTGVLDFGQGNVLRDTFGSAVPEGHVNAPGIVNLVEEDARTQVKKVGLDYLIVGTSYDDKIQKGRILTQSPMPGRVILLGDAIEVTISGGSREDATQPQGGGEEGPMTEEGAAAVLPDLTYQNAVEAMATVEGLAGYHLLEPMLNYDDAVADGLVISQEVGEDGGVLLTVSAGRRVTSTGAEGRGEPRGVLLVDHGGEAMVKLVESAAMPESDIVMHALSFSADGGATWQIAGTDLEAFNGETLEYYRMNYFSRVRFNGVGVADAAAPSPGPTPIYLPVAEILGLHNPEAAGQTLMLRVDTYVVEGSGVPLYSVPLAQTFSFELQGEPFAIARQTRLAWTDLDAFADSGALAESAWLNERYKFDQKYGDLVENTEFPMRLEGAQFVKGERYRVKRMRDANRYDYASLEDGSLVLDAGNNGNVDIWVFNWLDLTHGGDASLHQVLRGGEMYTMQQPAYGS